MSRRLSAIGIGQAGVDSATLSSGATLINALADQADAAPAAPMMRGGMRGKESQNIDPLRYLERNEQYRIVPIYVEMLVDQKKIPDVLICLTEAEFRYTIHQVTIVVPEKFEAPKILEDLHKPGQARERENIVFNTMQVNVWGQMRIYEMPPSMKQAYEEKVAAAEKADDKEQEKAEDDGDQAKTQP